LTLEELAGAGFGLADPIALIGKTGRESKENIDDFRVGGHQRTWLIADLP
jgi:hypothetical protein